MAEATSNISFTTLETEIEFMLGMNSTPAAADTARIKVAINAGYRKFLQAASLNGKPPHRWSFMSPRYTLTLNPPFSANTITIVDGVVTKVAGTAFPSWAAQGELILSGEHYTVATRTGDNGLTLDDTTLDLAAGSSYVLTQTTYEMPDDFAWVEGNYVTFEPRGSYPYKESAVQVSEGELRRNRETLQERSGRPWQFAVYVQPLTQDGTESNRWLMEFGPVYPDSTYYGTFRYRKEVLELSGTNLYPLGGAVHAETIRYACLSEAERMYNDSSNEYEQLYLQKLATSIGHDQRAHQSSNLGYNRDRSDDQYEDKSPYFRRYVTSHVNTYTPL